MSSICQRLGSSLVRYNRTIELTEAVSNSWVINSFASFHNHLMTPLRLCV